MSFSLPWRIRVLPMMPTPLPICGAAWRERASVRMNSYTPSISCPPYCLGQDMPSQPLAANFFMKARRSGVSES